MLPLFAMNEEGYKRIIYLSSKSFLENDNLSEPHINFDDLLENNEGVAIFSGSINGLFGKLFDKGKFSEISNLYNFWSRYATSTCDTPFERSQCQLCTPKMLGAFESSLRANIHFWVPCGNQV